MSVRLREHSGPDYANTFTQNNTLVHSVGRHFNEEGHAGIQDMRIYVLQYAKGHPDSEGSLVHRLDWSRPGYVDYAPKYQMDLMYLTIKRQIRVGAGRQHHMGLGLIIIITETIDFLHTISIYFLFAI